VLRRGSRNFQLAYQIGLLDCGGVIERITREPELTSDESRALPRALANYFSGAALMPYGDFLRAAQEERYDLDLLQAPLPRELRAGLPRLTRSSARARRESRSHGPDRHRGEHLEEVQRDGIHFPRFGGLCPSGTSTPPPPTERIRVQIARLPDGRTYFSIARTIRKTTGRLHAPEILTPSRWAATSRRRRALVYADGMDLGNPAGVIPVRTTCGSASGLDCGARAFPPCTTRSRSTRTCADLLLRPRAERAVLS